MLRFYRTPGMTPARTRAFESAALQIAGRPVGPVATEFCFYVDEGGRTLDTRDLEVLQYLLAETFEPEQFGRASFIDGRFATVLEYGPRLNFETAWSSAAVEICHRSGVGGVRRIERSLRLGLPVDLAADEAAHILGLLYDRMTEMPYPEPLSSFESGLAPEPVAQIRLLERGMPALEEFSQAHGCGWDAADLELISGMFRRLGRNPTDVELFQIAQANSEHSRHWVFKGELWIDGRRVPERNLMDIVRQPLQTSGPNSVIAFCDDSSAIRGTQVHLLVASDPLGP
jgi:phosphoribosylformylglycinamidine synthase